MRRIFFLLLLPLSLFAQQPAQLALQQGHSNTVTALCLVNNEQYLASAGWDNVIKIWELRSGLLLRTLSGHTGNINALIANAEGTMLISGGNEKKIRFWDVTTFKNVYSAEVEGSVNVLTLSADKKTLIAGTSQGIFFINPKDGKIIRQNYYNPLAVSASADLLYISFYNYSAVEKENIYAINLKNDSVVGRWQSSEKFPKAMALSPDGSLLAVGGSSKIHLIHTRDKSTREIPFPSGIVELKFLSNTEIGVTTFFGCTAIDLDGKELSHTGSLNSKTSVLTADQKKILMGSDDGSIEIKERSSGVRIAYFPGSLNYVQALHFGTQGKITAVQNGEINAWYLSALQKENLIPATDYKHKSSFRFDYNSFLYSDHFRFSADAQFLVAGYNSTSPLSIYDLSNRKLLKTALDGTSYGPVGISKDGRFVGLAKGKEIKILDRTRDSVSILKTDHSDYIKSLHFGNTGKYLLSASVDKTMRLYATPLFLNARTIKSIPYNVNGYEYDLGGTGSVIFSRNDKYMVSFGQKLAIVYDVATGKELKKLEGHKGNVLSADYNKDNTLLATGDGDKEIKLWSATTFLNTFTLKGHNEKAGALSFSADKNILASGSDDGVIKLWNSTTGKEIATLIADKEDNYIIITPDNYYSTTKNGHKMLAFRVGNELFPFEQFDLQYNRPDIVLSRLGFATPELINSYKKAYEKRLKKLGYTQERFSKDFHMPQIDILDKPSIPARTDKNKLSLQLNASDSKYKLERLIVSVNDVPIYGSKGKAFAQAPAIPRLDKEELLLSKGLNKISISVLNEKGVQSLTENIFVEYVPEEKVKPNLYLISIGTSKYKNEQYNLNYASKDASDLCNLFASRQQEYANVFIDKIADENCTIENIQALKSKLQNTNIDDEVILFIAGHGVLDHELNYYLATHDMDFTAPASRGLPYEKLEELLDGIPARKKLLLMDACHSGEVDKDEMQLQATAKKTEEGDITFRSAGPGLKHVGLENSFEMMKQLFTDLRKGNGTTVISSAGGGEYAMEGSQWKNGVFTYCLVTGLKEMKADKNKDGKVMLSELQHYLQRNVSEMTNGKQKPTSRVENISNDWRVW